MLEGEPSWLVGVEAGAAADRWTTPPLALGGSRSGLALHVSLGDAQPLVEAQPRPAVAARGELAVVLDGALFDRGLVASALGTPAPPDEDDAELLLRAYVELGERLLPLLRGSFGLVVWD